jgi:hypothetical protein
MTPVAPIDVNRPPPVPTPMAWIQAEDMPKQPKAWYWAAFPGTWVWYSPERNACRGIDFGDTHWHALGSKRYWGPWITPECVPSPHTPAFDAQT